ncbi:hypothetical protein OC846_000042 [Tilletia horrida]|uniref:W2 domain-containing protein n=1 Tax=Tilletia horrida TaxID=155126 RepID=A0AAN6GYK1_9BASI|nr:hypothetical protein OC845_005932 [Tilletia horrida]KAK0558050.1 hypothetical protein OC846_000042 [Tilletia horrida]
MTSTPPSTAPSGKSEKPALTGARIKQRKGVQKSQAKFEPEAFRDALYKHLEPVKSEDFDGFAAALDKAGNTLDYRKYADQFFEILIVGGLLAPGGQFVDDDAPPSPFSISNAKSATPADVKPYVTVLDKVIRRYKFLQKVLEESTLPSIIQYINRYSEEQNEKLACATALLIQQGLASASVLQAIQKDHLTKDDLPVNFISSVFRAYLADSSMDHLGTALRKGGIKDLLLFFPPQKREQPGIIVSHFKAIGLTPVAEYWQRRQVREIKDQTVARVVEILQESQVKQDEAAEGENAAPAVKAIVEATRVEVVEYLKGQMKTAGVPFEEFVPIVWEGIIKGADLSDRPDQMEAQTIKEVNKYAPILEPFTPNARSEIALINSIQLYLYEDTRIMKTFPNILKVLYNEDVINSAAILYWASKGAKPQGKQHFLKATEPLVKALQAQEEEDDDEEEE